MTMLLRLIATTAIATIMFGSSVVFADTGQLSARKGIVVDAPAADVWDLIRGYNSLEVWHPAVVDSFMVGDGMSGGSIRVLILGGDARIVEELTSFSDQKMNYSYKITDSPLPVTNYESTLQVVSERNTTKVIWQSTFDAKDVSDDEAINLIAGVYSAGLESIKARFE